MPTFVLLAVVGLPFVAAAISAVLADRRPDLAPRVSSYLALVLAVVVSLAVVDLTILLPLLGGRALDLSAAAQLGIQLMALVMLGLSMSMSRADETVIAEWLPLAWLSLGGLTIALLVTSLTLAVLALAAAGLVWALVRPADQDQGASGPVLRYAALLALASPLLLLALRLAEMHTGANPELEPLILALTVTGFGLLLGLFPLHSWTVTLAAGSPNVMVLGVLGLVQTSAFVLLLRTLARYPWMVQEARPILIVGGALSALVGGWLALSSRRDDPDDWLAYALIANTGLLVAGLGTQSQSAGQGVTLLLFARVLAIVAVALAPRGSEALRRVALLAAALALAATPGLAGFPGLWLILIAMQQGANSLAAAALVVGSGLVFAMAVRRGWLSRRTIVAAGAPLERGQWPVAVLIVVLVVLGLAPQLVASAFGNALGDLYLPLP